MKSEQFDTFNPHYELYEYNSKFILNFEIAGLFISDELKKG